MWWHLFTFTMWWHLSPTSYKSKCSVLLHPPGNGPDRSISSYRYLTQPCDSNEIAVERSAASAVTSLDARRGMVRARDLPNSEFLVAGNALRVYSLGFKIPASTKMTSACEDMGQGMRRACGRIYEPLIASGGRRGFRAARLAQIVFGPLTPIQRISDRSLLLSAERQSRPPPPHKEGVGQLKREEV